MRAATPKKFEKETDLCAAFIKAVETGGGSMRHEKWTAYAETAGFDILLVRESDGAQIGVEAKLRLNVTVVCQSLPDWRWHNVSEGPDYRAVLVPGGCSDHGLGEICRALGVTVIRVLDEDQNRNDFQPHLPSEDIHFSGREWLEWCPAQRCKLPDYVPDVVAGASGPSKLTQWKIGAIKLAIIMEERPVTREDFRHLGISPSRWTQSPYAWLVKTDAGWLPGAAMPDFKAQHPVNYEQIKADKERWMRPTPVVTSQPLRQGELL